MAFPVPSSNPAYESVQADAFMVGRDGIESTHASIPVVFHSDVSLEKNVRVKGNVVADEVLFRNVVAKTADISGDVTVGGKSQTNSLETQSLDVSGDTRLNTLSVAGELRMTSAVATGASSLSHTSMTSCTVDGDCAAMTIRVGTNVDPSSSDEHNDRIATVLDVSGNSKFMGDTTHTGNYNLQGSLRAQGDSTLARTSMTSCQAFVIRCGPRSDRSSTEAPMDDSVVFDVNGNSSIVRDTTHTGDYNLQGTMRAERACEAPRFNCGPKSDSSSSSALLDDDVVLDVNGNAKISGDTTQTGNCTRTGDLTATGNAYITGDSTYTGNSVRSGNATVKGLLSLSSNPELVDGVVLDVSGNANIAGDTTQTGNCTRTGDLTATGNAYITGDSTYTGDSVRTGNATVKGLLSLSSNPESVDSIVLDVNGNTNIVGDNTHAGDYNLQGTLTVDGVSVCRTMVVGSAALDAGMVSTKCSDAPSGVAIPPALRVDGTTQCDGTLNVAGPLFGTLVQIAALEEDSDAVVLDVRGPSSFAKVAVLGDLSITGNSTVVGNSSRTGNVSITGSTQADALDANVDVDPALKVVGHTSVVGNSSYVGDSMRSGNATVQGLLSLSSNPESVDGVVLDVTGHAKIAGDTTQKGNSTRVGDLTATGNAFIKGNNENTGDSYRTGSLTVKGTITADALRIELPHVTPLQSFDFIGNAPGPYLSAATGTVVARHHRLHSRAVFGRYIEWEFDAFRSVTSYMDTASSFEQALHPHLMVSPQSEEYDTERNRMDLRGYCVRLSPMGRLELARNIGEVEGVVVSHDCSGIFSETYDSHWKGKYMVDRFHDNVMECAWERSMRCRLVSCDAYDRSTHEPILQKYASNYPKLLEGIMETLNDCTALLSLLAQDPLTADMRPRISPEFNAEKEYIPRIHRLSFAPVATSGTVAIRCREPVAVGQCVALFCGMLIPSQPGCHQSRIRVVEPTGDDMIAMVRLS